MDLETIKLLTDGATLDGVDCLSASVEMGNGNACEVETGIFLYALARRYKPKLVVHTGTHMGYDVSWIALGLKENGINYPHMAGYVVTADMADYEQRKTWDRLSLYNIISLVGDSRVPETWGNVLHPIQWVHLDADHSEESIWLEYQALLPHMDKQKCILSTHDSRLDVRVGPGFNAVIRDLEKRRAEGNGWKHIGHFPLRNLRGIDFLMLSNEDI